MAALRRQYSGCSWAAGVSVCVCVPAVGMQHMHCIFQDCLKAPARLEVCSSDPHLKIVIACGGRWHLPRLPLSEHVS